jgi:O-antigen/teichoic acid export membrane protein
MAPVSYAIKIIMTGTVSPEDYGIFVAVISFVMILWAYNDIGMSDSLNFFLPEHLNKKDKKKVTQTLSIALTTQIISSSILAILLFLVWDVLAKYYFKTNLAGPLLQIFIIFFFADNIFRSINTFFQSLQDTKMQKWTDFLRQSFQLIGVFLIFFGWKASIINFAWAYNAAVILWVILSLSILYYKYNSYFTFDGWRFWYKEFKKIFKYAIFIMLSANVSALLWQVDKQMIVILLGTMQAGIYDIYLSLIRIPFMFLLPGVYFLFPVFSDLLKKEDHQKVQIIYTFTYELFAVLAVFMTSFFILLGDELVYVLFPEYSMSWKILLYSSPFLIFNFLLQIDFQLLNALWKPYKKTMILLCALWMSLITNYIFLSLWGIVGSAFASGIGWVFIWLLSFREIKTYLYHFRWKIFIKNLIGVCIFSTIFLLYINLSDFFSWRIQMLIWIWWVIALYGILFILLNSWEFLRIKKLFLSSKNIW